MKLAYFESIAEKKKGTNKNGFSSVHTYLTTFSNGNLKFSDLTVKFGEGFKEYLKGARSIKRPTKTLGHNTASQYFNKFKSVLKKAYKEGDLIEDLNSKLDSISVKDVVKQSLTVEELRTLANAECGYPLVKEITLFSALTGIPFMELKNLRWEQIEVTEGRGIVANLTRQKTWLILVT